MSDDDWWDGKLADLAAENIDLERQVEDLRTKITELMYENEFLRDRLSEQPYQ